MGAGGLGLGRDGLTYCHHFTLMTITEGNLNLVSQKQAGQPSSVCVPTQPPAQATPHPSPSLSSEHGPKWYPGYGTSSGSHHNLRNSLWLNLRSKLLRTPHHGLLHHLSNNLMHHSQFLIPNEPRNLVINMAMVKLMCNNKHPIQRVHLVY